MKGADFFVALAGLSAMSGNLGLALILMAVAYVVAY